MIEQNKYRELPYLISYPEDFDERKQYPLIVFLHGAGTRCDDLNVLANNACFVNLQKRQTARGYLILAPLCGVHNWNEVMQTVLELVDQTRNLPFADVTRVYATGNSMGGYGTWEIAMIKPDWFAAIMPVCGGGLGGFGANLANVPVRTFHGLCDTVVDPIESMQMVKSVNQKGGYAELILFPHHDHNCWDTVYTTEENYDWLLQFSKTQACSPDVNLSGEKYG
ncbi:MAG: hypothetical protein IJB88_00765 [Clostridia bacterium]|nr:hypothetical protein [Clostridia bacterium]